METIKTYSHNLQLLNTEEPEHLNFTSIKYGYESHTATFVLKAEDAYQIRSYSECKDKLLFTAIKNLIKKNEFLQLFIQLIDGQISEEEYEEELDNHSDKYFINLAPLDSERHFKVLLDILQKFNKEFSVDEVSEIFGISTQSFLDSSKR